VTLRQVVPGLAALALVTARGFEEAREGLDRTQGC
jgi:hypothetical protein